MTLSRNTSRLLQGLVLGVVFLALYLSGLSRSPGAGQPAALLTIETGLIPRLAPDHPCWSALGRLVRLFSGQSSMGLAAVSALCGAGAVWLLYDLIAAFCGFASGSEVEQGEQGLFDHLAVSVGAIAGAAALGLSKPFWYVATQVHPAAFHVLLLLAAFRILLHAFSSTSLLPLCLLSLLCGIGSVEFATFIVFMPLLVIGGVAVLWRQGRLNGGSVVLVVIPGIVGLSLYLLAAAAFHGSDGYHLREYSGYWKIVWFMWRDQYRLIMSSLPREGWLLVLIVVGAPWLAMVVAARKSLNEDPEWSTMLLHMVMAALCVVVLLETRVSPWALLGYSRLLVTPYVLTGWLCGYVLVYFIRLAGHGRTGSFGRAGPVLSRILGVIGGVVLVAGVAWGGWASAAEVRTHRTDTFAKCAGVVLDVVHERCAGEEDGDGLILVSSALEPFLRMRVAQTGDPAAVISLAGGESETHLRYLASKFDKPRLQNLARIGMVPLLEELVAPGSASGRHSVVLGSPDVWLMGGAVPVPDRLVFYGVEDPKTVDCEALLRKHRAFWSDVIPSLNALAGNGELMSPNAMLAAHLLRQCSLVANNLGVFIEDAGYRDEAFGVYGEAWGMQEANISALLNLKRLAADGFGTPEQQRAIDDSFEEIFGRTTRKPNIFALTALYGYVRSPEAFSGVARMWALAGQPKMAASSLRKALESAGEDRRRMIKEDLAYLHLGDDQMTESEALYNELFADDPENQRAILGLARIAAGRGDFEKAAQLLEQGRQAGIAPQVISMETATVDLMRLDYQAARKRLERIVRDGGSMQARTLLSRALIGLQDWSALENMVTELRSLEGAAGLASEIRGVLALQQRNLEAARGHYREALTLQPGHIPLFERVLRLELMGGSRDHVERLARELLGYDASNALGNYVIGTVRVSEGEWAQAEEALRTSIDREPMPEALNDLAWLYLQKGELEGAAILARRAISLSPKMAQAWDTLGEIRMRQADYDRAEKALQQALTLAESHLSAYLHMAELQLLRGDTEYARELLQLLSQKEGRLSSGQKKRYDELRLEAGQG